MGNRGISRSGLGFAVEGRSRKREGRLRVERNVPPIMPDAPVELDPAGSRSPESMPDHAVIFGL
jgi:hypothetical protein